MKRQPIAKKRKPGGFREPTTRHFSIDKPFLSIGTFDEKGEVEWQTSDLSLPSHVVLKGRIQPVPIKDLSPVVQLRINGQSFASQKLYGKGRVGPKPLVEGGRIEAVEIYVDGTGAVREEIGKDLQPFQHGELGQDRWIQLSKDGPSAFGENQEVLLYRKPFGIERTKQVLETRTYTSLGRTFVSPPNRFDIDRILRPYGGYCPKGCSPKDIQQLYYSLSETDEKTQVSLSLSSAWDVQKRLKEGVYIEPLPIPEEALNFLQAIEGGYPKIWVCAKGRKELYCAVMCEERENDPQYVDIIFAGYSPSV